MSASGWIVTAACGWILAILYIVLWIDTNRLLRKAWKRENQYVEMLDECHTQMRKETR